MAVAFVQGSQSLELKREAVALSDAHCHLDLFQNPMQTVEEALGNGVRVMVTCGVGERSSAAAISIAQHKNVFATIGIDPEHADSDYSYLERLEKDVLSSRKVVGIGEIGLDYKNGIEDREKQKEVFKRQIEIAKRLEMAIVVHSRNAMPDVMEIVMNSGIKKAMFHYFEGDEVQAKALAQRGYVISIPPFESSKRKRVIKALEMKNIVAETDSPAVGKSPSDVSAVLKMIAEIKGISFEEAAHGATETLKELFYI